MATKRVVKDTRKTCDCGALIQAGYDAEGYRKYKLMANPKCGICKGKLYIQDCPRCVGCGLLPGSSIGEGAKVCKECEGAGQIPLGEVSA